jgi:hypothetical protein
MSNACDPRNRPGFETGDAAAFMPDRMAAHGPTDELRTVLMAGFSTALIVAMVFAIVLLTH